MPHISVQTTEAPLPLGPYSQAIQTDSLVFVSGQIGVDPVTGEIAIGAIEQTRVALRHLTAILRASGLGPEQVVRVDLFLSDMNDFAAVNAAYVQIPWGPHPPARQTIESPPSSQRGTHRNLLHCSPFII